MLRAMRVSLLPVLAAVPFACALLQCSSNSSDDSGGGGTSVGGHSGMGGGAGGKGNLGAAGEAGTSIFDNGGAGEGGSDTALQNAPGPNARHQTRFIRVTRARDRRLVARRRGLASQIDL
jgi:hypothetical protein